MSTIYAQWEIGLYCKCPWCFMRVDLIKGDDFWAYARVDPIEHNTARANNLNVSCPECGQDFNVCLVY